MCRPDPLDRLFSALADPTRRRLLALLVEDEMTVTDLAAPFEMSLAAISKHIAVLEGAGLVSREKRGRVSWIRVEPDRLRPAAIWMQSFGQYDPLDLDALEALLIDQSLLPDDGEPDAEPLSG